MKDNVILVIEKEIRTCYANKQGVFVIDSDIESFDLCYPEYNFTEDEKHLIIATAENIIHTVNEDKIDMDTELQHMKVSEFLEKYNLDRFLPELVLKH